MVILLERSDELTDKIGSPKKPHLPPNAMIKRNYIVTK
jgi:hypothetical protein